MEANGCDHNVPYVLDPATNDIVYQKEIDALCLLNKMDLIPAGEAGYTSGTLMNVFAEKLVSLETNNEFWMSSFAESPSSEWSRSPLLNVSPALVNVCKNNLSKERLIVFPRLDHKTASWALLVYRLYQNENVETSVYHPHGESVAHLVGDISSINAR
jgi:hypothetical protein